MTSSSSASNDIIHLSKDHHYCSFSSKHQPALYVYPGDRICIETWDCYGGLFFDQQQQQPIDNPTSVVIERSKLNPVTGPIFIHSAEPGDVLAVTIHDIQPNRLGVAQCGPTFGQLSHTVDKHHFRFFDITPASSSWEQTLTGHSVDSKENYWNITMREETNSVLSSSSIDTSTPITIMTRQRRAPISFTAKPMIGVMGVAPIQETISTMPAGTHGGNLDNPMNTIGSTLYLPVFHSGALFSVGDVHASQGDGEICGTGVEVGATVILSFQVLSQASLQQEEDSNKKNTEASSSSSYSCTFPITETSSSFMTYGVVLDDIPQSTVVACDEASKLLQQQWCFTPEEAYIFLGVCGHLGLCQANHPDCNNTPIARMVIPKIEACPRPFACLLRKEREGKREKDHENASGV